MENKIERKLILVSNDDGYMAPGVHRLCEWLSRDYDVVAVCPDGPRSGQSMAITVSAAMRLENLGKDEFGIDWWKLNGTPVDCVKLSMHTIFRDRKPDMVIAGINHGSNAAINVVYSGTMGAVMEGCAQNIPSIGYSLTNHSMAADFGPCRPFVEKLTALVADNGLPDGICLNVNIPSTANPLQGMRLTRACRGRWTDEYKEYRDPAGRPFYMLSGKFLNEEPDSPDTDEWCLHHDLVSVVPVMLDRTAPTDNIPAFLKI